MSKDRHDDVLGGPLAAPAFLRLHLKEPDFTRPIFQVPEEKKKLLLEKLTFLYGEERAAVCYPELERYMQVYCAHKTPEMIEDEKNFNPANRFTEKDAILITYGDSIRSPGKKPLKALADMMNVFFRRLVNTVHILPFFPYSSDRGFSVTDFEEVDPRLGAWEDIEHLGIDFKLMFDGVVNHVSSKSRWFQRFLAGNPEYQDYFITFSTKDSISDDHLSLILRPRTTPVLTSFDTLRGPKFVWTTFSPDQVDLNYKNEKVLLRVVQILLFYVRHGADIIRLDAITYLWHELGTTCTHLQETHAVVKLLRTILDTVSPHVALLTETNVPHEENISYFGDGSNEAQMVYNFALPPLVLLAFHAGDCSRLAEWADSLEQVSDTASYFNFLDSHDGVGLLPVKNIISEDDTTFLANKAIEYGGLVSHRDAGNGKKSPYELNITWFNALNAEDSPDDDETQVNRFVASRAIALVLMGVPGIYLPSLVGGRNDQEGMRQTGEARSINRGIIDERLLIERLGDASSPFHKIAKKYFHLLEQRTGTPAFHPNSRQQIVRGNDAVFCVLRETPDKSQRVLALINVTAKEQETCFPCKEIGPQVPSWMDLLSEENFSTAEATLRVTLKPYQILWLTPVS
jgi:sucrose phosphorylase